jgi:cytochrome P450
MRIAPIAHTHVRQVKAGFEYENCKFRTGDIMLLSVFGFNHDPDIWKEPDKFSPERFANKSLTSSLFPFGLGRHTCPGKYLAYQDIVIVLVSLLQKFRIRAITTIHLDPCSSLLLEPSKEQSIELIAR